MANKNLNFETHSHQDDHFSDDEDENVSIPLDALKLILLKALSWYFVHEHMTQQTKRAMIPLKELPFMNSALSKLLNSDGLETLDDTSAFSDSTNHDVIDMHAKRLDTVLKSWNFKRIAVSGDGNCLFYAVAHALLQKNNYASLAETLGFSTQTTQKELAKLLRQATVNEWLGENSSHYQSFLTGDQLHTQAHKFLQDGEYSGDLGDLVLPALVNVLSQPVTIFTSAENMPVVTLTPISSLVIDSHPLFVAYNQDKSGHYDAVSHLDQIQEENVVQPELETIKCTCGRNSTKGVSCVYSLYHYSTKCPCFKAGRPCNCDCRCRGCQNPHGVRADIKIPKTGQKRKRERYDTQIYPLKGKKTTLVADQVSEEVNIGGMSGFEYLLISAIIQYAYTDLEDWTDVEKVDPGFISKNFDAILNIITMLNMQLPMFKRNRGDIKKALKHYEMIFNVFYKLHT